MTKIATLRDARFAIAVLVLAIAAGPASGIEFLDVSASVGITTSNQSWGVAWGDLDGDGDPDVWSGNHGQPPTIYRNDIDLDGTFTDISASITTTSGDAHGAQWADIDNDGDQDFVELTGSGAEVDPSPNRLFRNDGGTFIEVAASVGLALDLARARNPLFFDWDGDGRLDLLVGALPRLDGLDPAGLFVQQPDGTFVRTEVLPAGELGQAPIFGMLTDSNLDGVMDLAVFDRVEFPSVDEAWRILDTGALPFSNLACPTHATGIKDIAIADFNGDLTPDHFEVRARNEGSDVVAINPTTTRIRVAPIAGGEGVDLTTTDVARFIIPKNWFWSTSDVFVGASGAHPPNLDFTLDPSNPAYSGLAFFIPGVSRGVYIGYDDVAQAWMIRVSVTELNMNVGTREPVTQITPIGFTIPADSATQDRLLLLQGGSFVDVSVASGLGSTSCTSVAAGDFDNDRDVDLYLSCADTVVNRPNILLENDGAGVFTAVPLAGGAAGPGATMGRGDTVTTVDYDQDGFLDLFLTNGAGWPPFGFGPHQLFRNQGNANHWLEIDLEGTTSNRDGIGAIVFATTGETTQLREQGGGMHHKAQNHSRLHFGLGENVIVDELTIQWPSGEIQTLTDVAADQVLTVIELPEPSVFGASLAGLLLLRTLHRRRNRRSRRSL